MYHPSFRIGIEEEYQLIDPQCWELIGYVTVWAGFPLALYYFCQGIGRQGRFLRTATALNWSAVVQILLILPVYLIAAGGILSPGFATLAAFVVVMVTLFYIGFIAHTALEVSPPIAALVVAIDPTVELLGSGKDTALQRDSEYRSDLWKELSEGFDKAKFRKPVLPGDVLHLEMELLKIRRGIYTFSGKALVNGQVVAQAELRATFADK